MKSRAATFIFLLIVAGLAVGGFHYYQRQNAEKEITELLKNYYGYTNFGYSLNLQSYRKDGPGQYAVIHVSCLPESVSWDIACMKIGEGNWGLAPEQMKKDMNDLDDIGHCLNSLAAGLRVGEYVINSKSEVNSCRDAIKLYNIKHPKSQMKNIGE